MSTSSVNCYLYITRYMYMYITRYITSPLTLLGYDVFGHSIKSQPPCPLATCPAPFSFAPPFITLPCLSASPVLVKHRSVIKVLELFLSGEGVEHGYVALVQEIQTCFLYWHQGFIIRGRDINTGWVHIEKGCGT